MSDVRYLTFEDLLALVRALGAGPVRDPGLLDSAAARPRSSVLGADAYPTLPLKAGALMHSVARNHALVDGNRRLALLAAVVFLDLNDLAPNVDDDTMFALVMDVPAGAAEVDEIAARLAVGPRGAGAAGWGGTMR